MQIYLIRHPQPSNVRGLCYGRREVALDDDAVRRAAAAARLVLPEATLKRAAIFSSPSSRCLLLARELVSPREPMIDSDLAEMDFGSWEGQPWDSVPRDELDAWAADIWGYRPGGAESAAMVAARWQRWVRVARRCTGDAAVAVTHAGVIRTALVHVGLLSAAEFARAAIAFASVHCVDLDALSAGPILCHSTPVPRCP
jgi:alpha-ribazole phosphatase